MVTNVDISTIAESGAEVWEPRPEVKLSDFIAQNVRLSPEYEADPGPCNFDENPWWVEPLNCILDPDVESEAIKKSTQVGGTLQALMAILGIAHLDPAPALWLLPTQDEAKLNRDRLYTNAEESTELIASRVPPERLRNLVAIDLETALTYLAWSGSKQRVRGKPCKYVFDTEKDVHETGGEAGTPSRAAKRRSDRFPGSNYWGESTPVGDDSPIDADYEASDKRRWYCKCPHCGRWQYLRFFPVRSGENAGRGGIAGYHDENGQRLPIDVARARAHYVCLNGCKILSHNKRAMLRGGRWVPEGQWIDSETDEIQGTPKRSGRVRGYHLWKIFNPNKVWGDIVVEYYDHLRDGSIREFFQDVLGEKYESAKSLPKWRILGRRLAGKHKRHQVPEYCYFLTAACDVQADRTYYSVRGWAPGRSSWLIDWGEFMRDESEVFAEDFEGPVEPQRGQIELSSDLLQIDNLLDVAYPVVDASGNPTKNPIGKSELPIRLIVIDSNYRTGNAHDYVQDRNSTRLRNIRGDDKVDPKERFRFSKVERNTRTGELYQGGPLQLWGIYVNFYKQLIADRLAGSALSVGSFFVTSDTLDRGEKYLRQLVNEPPTVILDKNGRKKTVFKPKQPSIGVDFWDTTVYCEAAADMVVGKMGWSEKTWRKKHKDNENRKARQQIRRRRPKTDPSILEP